MKKLLRPCPICNNQDGDVLHHQQFAVPDDYSLPNAYDVVACKSCGLVYADTPATQQDYEQFYAGSSIYAQPGGAVASTTPPSDITRLEQIAALFARHIPDNHARILDIGCANGGLLQILARLGFDNLTGIDPSAVCVQNTRNTGHQAYRGDLAHLPAQLGRFDAVVLTAVLEHVLDLQAAVSALAGTCAEHGRIFLEVPDAAGYVNYLHSPFQDINTEHINHFSPATLANLMACSGFAPVLEEQTAITGPSGLTFASLQAAYERRPDAVSVSLSIDTNLRIRMEHYIEQSQLMMHTIDQRLQVLLAPWPQVIVWGTGQLCMKLLCNTALKDAKIAAYTDGNSVNVGGSIHGVPIVRPEALESHPDLPILIATLLHTGAIRERIAALGLTNPVLTLTPD